MKHPLPAQHRAAHQAPPGGRARGQSSLEYLVACLALALALGIGMSNEQSVLWQLLEALRFAYQRFAFALSLPT